MHHRADRSRPHLSVSLIAPQTELDLNGRHPFHLHLSVVLQAEGPVLLYTADTFLSPQAALRQGGLNFSRTSSTSPSDKQPLPRSTVNVNRGSGTSRPADPSHFLILEPEKPKVIEIPFGSHKELTSASFDVRFWTTTSAFAAGETYEVSMPSTCKVTWWRWTSPEESKPGDASSLLPGYEAHGVVDSSQSWWSGTGDGEGEGVPVLPNDEQMPIIPSGGSVSFTCVGKRMEPPGHATASN